MKKDDIAHKNKQQAAKLDIFSKILAQIAQKDATYVSILGPMAEELKQLSDQAGAGPTSLAQQHTAGRGRRRPAGGCRPIPGPC